jgi:two-component system, NarL family, nitrate/nitrite response regulator NarL
MKPIPPQSPDYNRHFDECPPSELTARELEIVCHIARGRMSKEIAALLASAKRRSKATAQNCFIKWKFRCVADVVRYAIRHGLIEP